jgi:hypothetical protein
MQRRRKGLRLISLLLLFLTLGCAREFTPATLVLPPHHPSETEDEPCLCSPVLPRLDQGERESGWIPTWL